MITSGSELKFPFKFKPSSQNCLPDFSEIGNILATNAWICPRNSLSSHPLSLFTNLFRVRRSIRVTDFSFRFWMISAVPPPAIWVQIFLVTREISPSSQAWASSRINLHKSLLQHSLLSSWEVPSISAFFNILTFTRLSLISKELPAPPEKYGFLD